MRKFTILMLAISFIFGCTEHSTTETKYNKVSKLATAETEQKIQDILSQMTLKEKAGQMINLGLPAVLQGKYWDKRRSVNFDTARFKKYIVDYAIGSIHNTPRYPALPKEWNYIVKTIQDAAMQKTRLGIPVLYGIDNIHGANYVMGSVLFPHQIAIAATWNTEMSKICGEVTSYESRAASLPWNFNPNADVAMNPIWGRISESFGEDPYLISEMTAAYIEGSQQNGLDDSLSTAVCVKHFLGYGAGRNGKDRANATIPENYLKQYYLPPFEKAIESGAMGVMVSSNAINGLPCHINKHVITDVLKGEMGFKGVVISDFSDVEFLTAAHLSIEDKKTATKMTVNAGLDLLMNPYDCDVVDYIIELVKEGEIPMSRVDDAVTRILRMKFYLNLFEKPYNNHEDFTEVGGKKHVELNYQSACEAITLLKNDSLNGQAILPLKNNKRVLVTGYTANSINLLNGAWSRSFSGADTKYNDPSKLTILDAIKAELGANNVQYVEGTNYLEDINTSKAVQLAKNVDYIIVCVGEKTASEKPSDINELPLPEVQQELVKKLAATNKPIIMVMAQGRPRIINDIEPLVDGILMAYYPGQEGGRAISDIIFGKVNPSGKLPYTYPKYTGNMVSYYHKKTDIRAADWSYNGFYRQYDFGFGLSYTSFAYSNLKIASDTVSGKQELTFSFDISNTGQRDGKEAVQAYIKDMFAIISPDSKRLVRFDKVDLKAGETKTIEFTLNWNDLAHVGINNEWIVEKGDFELQIGGNSNDVLTKKFYYKE
ncbi:MAG: glycoside hydrolase family 3 C-terminal domain-containing protein [Salinivirgaceae bacterium]|jgi:beta-glucosidase|nr:glycoside hydrolase family 3 C-terminal domain-containing protein [Salinivirgaceae bacterium]